MVDLAGWAAGLDALVDMIGGRFGRVEPRARVGGYMRGLLAGLERKNGWTLAEHAGAVSPDGMQRLLRTAGWDVDGVRDDLRGYVLGHLGGPDGVWVIDKTGFIKKGTRSAGVQRQYTGTTGKIDNCQLGVFVTYASGRGRALVDRELCLPRSWTEDPDRCRAAGIPEDVRFATKPQLGIDMLARAHAAGVLQGWVTAHEVYGQNPGLRDWLAAHQVPFVLATRNDDTLALPGGRRRLARSLATEVPTGVWERRSAGPGAHGLRLSDWATIELDPAGMPPGGGTGCSSAARSPCRHGGRAGFLPLRRTCCHVGRRPGTGRRGPMDDRGNVPDQQERGRPGPLPGPPLPSLVPTSPWPCSSPPTSPSPAPPKPKKGTHNQPRRADPAEQQRDPTPAGRPSVRPISSLARVITWSHWRRRRQHQARACHYRRRGHRPHKCRCSINRRSQRRY